MVRKQFPVVGMHCASCKGLIERIVRKQDGIIEADVNYGSETLTVVFDEVTLGPEDLNALVSQAGDYSLVLDGSSSVSHELKKDAYLNSLKRRLVLAFVLSIPFILLMTHMALVHFNNQGLIPSGLMNGTVDFLYFEIHLFYLAQWILSGVVLFYCGSVFFKSAWGALRKFASNMDTLIVMGTTTAWVYSSIVTFFPQLLSSSGVQLEVFYEAAVFIILFILLGRYLEERARRRTREGVKKLFELQAKDALVVRDGKEIIIPLDQVVLDDHVVVKPGAKIPVDGVIVEGTGTIDESMITGEPIPADKNVGDSVVGSTINRSGRFVFVATGVGENTLLSNIIQLVEDAQGSQAPIQRLADQVSSYFVPVVIAISILSFVFWGFGATSLGLIDSSVNPISFGVFIMMSVLIIACPCALGLATPTAIIVGTGAAARRGILIKSAEALEHAYRVRHVLFDKTGTITQGKPSVVDTHYFGDETLIDSYALSLESQSDHPVAQALVSFLNVKNIPRLEVKNFLNIEGKGLTGVVEGQTVFIVRYSSLSEFSTITSEQETVCQEFLEKGYTLSGIVVNGVLKGIYGISDTLKKESKTAIKALHTLGIDSTMLTGDHERSAQNIASHVGITSVRSEVLPEDKDRIVSEVKKSLPPSKLVAMVGDGTNDAPALTRADVGIAMGSGTDVAVESADIVIVKGSLSRVVDALVISRKTMRTIKQNLFWAFGYNVLAIPIAAGVLFPLFGITLSPIIASAAMAFSSVSVVLNSLRLRGTIWRK